MTTNLTFTVDQKDNALMVPNAALRWQPARAQIAPDLLASYAKLRSKRRSATDVEGQDRGIVWVQGEDSYVRYIEVRTGLSDSVHTEILAALGGGDLPEHASVITGETRPGEARSNGTNPFVAQPFGSKKKD